MFKNYRLLFLLLCSCCFSSALSAQKDTEFWFVAPEISQGAIDYDRPVAFRFSSYDAPATVTISQPANPAFPVQTIILAANSSGILEFPPFFDMVENTPADAVLDRGFLITSTSPITAYYDVIGQFQNNPEIFSLKGKNALGTEFYVPFQNILSNSDNYSPLPHAAFDIVASQDNTTVTIIPTQNIVGHAANVPFSIVLNRGQTYSAEAESQAAAGHPAGSKVSADKPVAITMKDDLLDATPVFGGLCRDMIGDQIVPVERTGTRYVVQKGALDLPDAAFVLATADGTSVFFDGNPAGILNAGQSMVVIISDRHFIETSAPAYLLQVSGIGCELGAAILPALDCSGSESVRFVRSTDEALYLMLVTRDGNQGGFSLNGDATVIQAGDFSFVPGSNFEFVSAIFQIPSSLAPAGASSIVENSVGLFQMGVLNGDGNVTGARLGFFSDFGNQVNVSENVQFCQGDTVLVHGLAISAPGVYQHVQTSTQGCDTLIQITASLSPNDTTLVSATTCDPFQAGVFEEIFNTSGGCDSVVITTVTLNPSDTTALEGTTCDPAAVGIFTQTLTNSIGCDSIVITTVTLAAPDSTLLNATTCDTSATGVFTQLLTNSSGCDSIVITTVSLGVDSTLLDATTCDTSATGVFTQLLTNSSGCDSIVITTVSLAAPDTTLVNATTCDITQVGVSEQLLSTSDGCDSLVITTTTLAASDSTLLNATTCDSTSIGVFTQFLTNSSGCDSLVILTVTFAGPDTTLVNATTCDSGQTGVSEQLLTSINGCDSLVITTTTLALGDSIFVETTTCDSAQAGVFVQVLSNINGCDSVVITTVTLLPKIKTYVGINLCPNDTIVINGVAYWQPVILVDTIPSATGGCDTFATTELIRVDNILVEDTLVFCPGDSVLINGVYYTQGDTAVHYNIPSTTGGCDTLVVITLEFGLQATDSILVEFCPGDTVTIGGVQYSQPGTVTATIPSTTGDCDTLVTYTLQFLPQPTTALTVAFCPGDSVTIDGVSYSQPGTVNGTIQSTTGGCDTLVTYTLQFAPQPTTALTIAFCPGDSVTIDGVSYSQPGTVNGTIASTTGGCDTLVTYTLELAPQPTLSQTIEFCAGDSVTLNGITYHQPGTVTLTLPATSGCDTIATYTLQYLVPSQPTHITLNCPTNIVVDADPGQTSVPVSYTLPVANSDCPCPGLALTLQQGMASGSNFSLGVTDVCYNAKDSCDNSITCCFKVTVDVITACDVKQISCIRYELLSITQDNDQRKTYRIRTVNNCANKMIYMAIQLPDGLVADLPANNSTYTAPSGRTYLVRNPNFSPFYSVRYSSVSDSIQGGESDVFKYTLPPQADPDYIHVMVKLEPQIYYEAHLNVFDCLVEYEPNPKPGAERDLTAKPFDLFPNPTDGALFADLSAWNGQDLQLRVYNSQGRLIASQRTTATEEAQSVVLPDQLSAGMYLLEVTPANGARQAKRFVVQR